MEPRFEKYNVSIVALSIDTAEEAAIHKDRDHLKLKLLSDSNLNVIRQYGVEHHKSLGFKTTKFIIRGIPLAVTPSFKAMAIPTTLLIDEDGIIRWIDQPDDYRLRSNGDRVLDAVKRVFDKK